MILRTTGDSIPMPKRRLPTHAERRERAQRRAQRHAELRLFGTLARQELEHLASRVAHAAALPQQVADERLAAQLDRLAAARAALELAEQLLQVDRDDEPAGEGGPTAVERQKVLEQAMGRWRRSSNGWWEVRWVPRPLVAVDEDRRTRQIAIVVQWVIHGPYYYFHWREEGRKETRYHGVEPPDDAPWAEPELPTAIDEAQLSPLTQKALRLARRLAALAGRPRLPRARRAALRRRLRRVVKRAQELLEEELKDG
ncbi:MAG TPA: hypothetical protein VFS21_27435 [Roseiflexaceae bacterium]|nr:hypothetical protein [Roseiflexaceae bacterium]